jgi:hypothetical protein
MPDLGVPARQQPGLALGNHQLEEDAGTVNTVGVGSECELRNIPGSWSLSSSMMHLTERNMKL